eukprot:s3919_g7.t3
MQPEGYRPNRDGKNLQILMCKLDGTIEVVAVLSVFRGSTVRKRGCQHLGTVRVGKPMPCGVPAASVKVLRGTLLQQEGQDYHWVTSCTATPLFFERQPSGCVIGELETTEMQQSATRLRVLLSPNAVLAVPLLLAGKIDVPELPPGNPEQDVGAPSEPSDATAQPAAEVRTFTGRSFMRKSLDKTVDLFIRGLIQEYRKRGVQIVNDDGKIKTKTGMLSYDEVCKMIPGFVLSSGSNLQYRFSQYVHRELTGLLPKAGTLAKTARVLLFRMLRLLDPASEAFQLEEVVIAMGLEDSLGLFTFMLPLTQLEKRCSIRRLGIHLQAPDALIKPPEEVENFLCAGFYSLAKDCLAPDAFLNFSQSQEQLVETVIFQLPYLDEHFFGLDMANYGPDKVAGTTPMDQPMKKMEALAELRPMGTLISGPLRRKHFSACQN